MKNLITQIISVIIITLLSVTMIYSDTTELPTFKNIKVESNCSSLEKKDCKISKTKKAYILLCNFYRISYLQQSSLYISDTDNQINHLSATRHYSDMMVVNACHVLTGND